MKLKFQAKLRLIICRGSEIVHKMLTVSSLILEFLMFNTFMLKIDLLQIESFSWFYSVMLKISVFEIFFYFSGIRQYEIIQFLNPIEYLKLKLIIIINMKYCLPQTLFHFRTSIHLVYKSPHHFCSSKPLNNIKFNSVDDYEITGFLGKGSTSRVYQGYNILTKKQVIIKLFKDIREQQKILHQFRVNQILAQSQHVVPLVGIIKDMGCGSYGLIFSNLHGIPLNHMAGKVEFGNGLRYMRDVLLALDFCHKNGIVHRDLKNSNILITKQGAKLFDFGLAKIQKQDDFKVTRFGTKCYYTPQVIFKMPYFSRKIDIWCCGLIMGQILSQIKPLMPYKSDKQTQRQIVQFSGYNQEIVSNADLKNMSRVNFKKLLQNKYSDRSVIQQASDIIEKMMKIDPNERPEAHEILNTDLFKNLLRIK